MSLSRYLRYILVALGVISTLPAQSSSPIVDLALVVAVDTSSSVDANEYRQQIDGLAAALASKDVLDAIRAGPNRRIALTVFQWSDDTKHLTVLPWTVISSQEEARTVARRVKAQTRDIVEGGTSIGGAMAFGEAVLALAPPSTRQALDISTDGHDNFGPPVAPVRARLVAGGVIINALVILNEFPDLQSYAAEQIIGGDGSFVMPAKDYSDYEEAIKLKLVREVVGSSLS
jgi:Protein of unknown function (DUF1194)